LNGCQARRNFDEHRLEEHFLCLSGGMRVAIGAAVNASGGRTATWNVTESTHLRFGGAARSLGYLAPLCSTLLRDRIPSLAGRS
jgi:hypothetical protein